MGWSRTVALQLLFPLLLQVGTGQRFVYNYEQPGSSLSSEPDTGYAPQTPAAPQVIRRRVKVRGRRPDPPPEADWRQSEELPGQQQQTAVSPVTPRHFSFDEVYQQFLKNVPGQDIGSWFNRRPNIVQIQPRRPQWNTGQYQTTDWNNNAPQQQNYQPPAQQNYQPQAQQNYQPPAQQNYQPPAQQNYQPPAQQNYWNNPPAANQNYWNNWNNAYQTPAPQNYWDNWGYNQQQQPPQSQPQQQQPPQDDWNSQQQYQPPAPQNQWDNNYQQPQYQVQQPRQDYWNGYQQPQNWYWNNRQQFQSPPAQSDFWSRPQEPARQDYGDQRGYQDNGLKEPQPGSWESRRGDAAEETPTRPPRRRTSTAPPRRADPPQHRPPPVVTSAPPRRAAHRPPPIVEPRRTAEETRKEDEGAARLAVAELPADEDGDEIPGKAGADYPTLHVIPTTTFSCSGRPQGYYADTETSCQVMHLCQYGGVQSSFLCPNGTIFSQDKFSCQWWYKSDCSKAPSFYNLNENLYKTPEKKEKP